jgi:DNA repair photolyase
LEIIPRLRRGKVLTKSDFGCLKGIPTVNITNGCLFQCAYCYARGYSQAPPAGAVELYGNLSKLLEEELARKRKIPPWVVINTSSDCFQPHPEILKVTYEVIRLLLDRGIGTSFLTKGEIPPPFLRLFAKSPEKVLAQIGLVSLSERYWKDYEPLAPPPRLRLQNIRKLKEIGIPCEVRMDPIIPFLTDTEREIKELCEELKKAGAEKVTLSYLHLRPAIQGQFAKELSPLHAKLMKACFASQEWKEIGSSSMTKLLPKIIREKGYRRIREIAQQYGIEALICQCKNPDLKADLCGSQRRPDRKVRKEFAQLPLFRNPPGKEER